MSKHNRAVYQCRECGASHKRWAGKCSACDAWNTLEEAQPLAGDSGGAVAAQASKTYQISEVKLEEAQRLNTGIDELNRVLGSGLVRGSVVLIGGAPGAGKSTLLLQACAGLCQSGSVLYASAEESLEQVVLRAERLGLRDAQVNLLAHNNVESIIATAREQRAAVLVVDSIQTVSCEESSSAPGSVSQVRESASILTRYAKQTGTALFLVGHVTKEGALAGPRVLEHLVDASLLLDVPGESRFRTLRASKNRFGETGELGVFAMTGDGMKGVRNPSAIFLSRAEPAVPGSAVTVTWEGSRPLLLDIQALVDTGTVSSRRLALGIDQARLNLLLAVLHRHAGVEMSQTDVYANVVGGVRVEETGVDLALLLAVLSSFRAQALATDLVSFAEVGLTGELRPVPAGQERLSEAVKHGFRRAIVASANAPRQRIDGIEVVAATSLQQALESALG